MNHNFRRAERQLDEIQEKCAVIRATIESLHEYIVREKGLRDAWDERPPPPPYSFSSPSISSPFSSLGNSLPAYPSPPRSSRYSYSNLPRDSSVSREPQQPQQQWQQPPPPLVSSQNPGMERLLSLQQRDRDRPPTTIHFPRSFLSTHSPRNAWFLS